MGTLAWTLLAAAGGLLAAALWRRHARRSRVFCGDQGLFVRDLDLGWIPWEEVEGAYPPTLHDPEALFLRLRVGETLARKLRGRDAARTRDPRAGETWDVKVDLSGAAMTPVELLQAILFRGEASRRAARRPLLQRDPRRSGNVRHRLSGSGPVLILPPGSLRAPPYQR